MLWGLQRLSLHLQVRENYRCVYAEASITWGLYLKSFILFLWIFVQCVVSHVFPSLSTMPSVQWLPWLCNCMLGEQLSLSGSCWDKLYHPSRHSFPVTCRRSSVAENSPGNTFHSLQWGGSGPFSFLHLQIRYTVSSILEYFGLSYILWLNIILMTSSATLICLVWVLPSKWKWWELMPVPAGDSGRPVQVRGWCLGLCQGGSRGGSWLWPGAFGSACSLSPGLAVFRVWAWAVSTLIVLALKHLGTKLQRSLCNIAHVLIFNLLLFVNILVLTVDVLSSNLLN